MIDESIEISELEYEIIKESMH